MGAMMIRFIPTWILVALTRRNYRLREAGKLADEWYWADIALLERGLALDMPSMTLAQRRASR